MIVFDGLPPATFLRAFPLELAWIGTRTAKMGESINPFAVEIAMRNSFFALSARFASVNANWHLGIADIFSGWARGH